MQLGTHNRVAVAVDYLDEGLKSGYCHLGLSKIKPAMEAGIGVLMSKLVWMLFQAAVAAPVYYFCAVTLEGQGMAPAIVAMFAALMATLFVGWLLDRARAFRIRHEAKRNGGFPPPIPGSVGDGSKHPGRIGVREDIRQLR